MQGNVPGAMQGYRTLETYYQCYVCWYLCASWWM